MNNSPTLNLTHSFRFAVSTRVRRVLEKALEGREIDCQDALTLFEARGQDLLALMVVADELRREQVGERVTFVQTRNINFTNVCYTGCEFCAFARHRNQPGAYTFELEEVVEQAKEAWAWGCTEVCMQGGLNPLLGGDIYVELVRAIKSVLPQIHIHAFSPFEIQYASQLQRRPVEDILWELKEAGLGSIPGTAAEILVPEVRQILTKNKLSTEAWVEIIKTAHRVGLPSSATIMYGHVDHPRHWAEHLALIRDIQRETGGFTEFVPLGFIYQNTQLYAKGLARPGPTGMESVKMHAVARLMLGRNIPNIQVSWVKMGLQMAQMCLNAGANDFGGTLHNERISRMAGATTGQYVSPAEFERLILDMGRIPAERTTTYDILHEGPRYYNPFQPQTMPLDGSQHQARADIVLAP
ncbi:MAG: 5-amino-6-(D-ribitylamino)uracil--L-tyrosine 4-hydroxyphenyl transferase CofH [Chloroflexi bacterium]|nr:5-amino-6-(D-ribitylamino)uracil--L-tyrosine 4-hydroxyphenyl transferase CofH [Chloroflexota bacterium]